MVLPMRHAKPANPGTCSGLWPGRSFAAIVATAVGLAAVGSARAMEWSPTREHVSDIKVRLIVRGERTIEATLLDAPAARDFAALLPLTLTLKDYAATEKIGDLLRRITTEGAPDGFEPKAGDIAFSAPWGNLAIFHKGFRYSPRLVRLVAITAGAERLAAPGPVNVTVERVD